jgi:hypothetical protein
VLVKLKFYIPEILLGALLTVAIFGMGMLFQSSSHQPTNNAEDRKAEQPAQKNVPVSESWLMHDAAGFFALWLVIVGLGQAGLFVWQLVLIRKSLAPANMAALAAKAAAEHIPTVEGAYTNAHKC